VFVLVRTTVAVGGVVDLLIDGSGVFVAPSGEGVVKFGFKSLTNNRADVVLLCDSAFVVDGVFDEAIGVLTVAFVEAGGFYSLFDFF
jgi:hypothetical protein